MTKPKIMKISYSETMPKESAQLFYRLLEKMIINSLPNDPYLIGLFLQKSLDEFSITDNEENV